MRVFPLGVLIAVALLNTRPTIGGSTGSGGGQVEGSPSFTVAVSGWGGALEPIGRFTGAVWVNTWPTPDESNVAVPALEDVPRSWLGKSVPPQWTLWKNGIPRTVTVAGTRRGYGSGGGCTHPAVLTLAKPQGGPDTFYENGLAVDTNQPIDAIRQLDRADVEWTQAAPFVQATFRANEQRAMDNGNRRWLSEVLAKAKVDLATVPIGIEGLFRADTIESSPMYYAIAARRARTADDTIGVIVWGWLRRDATGRWSASAVTGHPFGSDTPGYELFPLGVLRVAARVFWIVSRGGYESRVFEIYEIAGSNVVRVLATDSGAC